MSKFRFDNELLQYLGLSINKKYTIKEVRSNIRREYCNKRLRKLTDKFGFIAECVDEDDGIGCNGECQRNFEQFMDYVAENLIIRYSVPKCYFYSYNETPKPVTSLTN